MKTSSKFCGRFYWPCQRLEAEDFTFDDRDTKLQSRWNFAPGSSPKLNSVQKMYHQNEIQMQEDDEFR
jgi:hypothetical protein